MSDSELPKPAKRRRPRRTKDEVIHRILDAARVLFSERGFAATTTLDIARRAEVSETLLFRYFGNKAGLLDHIIYTPFSTLTDQFLTALEHRPSAVLAAGEGRELLEAFLAQLSESRRLMSIFAVRGPPDTSDPHIAAQMAEMRTNFGRAARGLERQVEAAGDPRAASSQTIVRLLFGMLIASVLFTDWLFPDGEPDRAELAAAISEILERIAR